MSTLREPIDVEDALQAALNGAGFDACALPLPESYGLPHVLVRCTGGSRQSFIQASSGVVLECRAETLAEAVSLGNEVAAFMLALPGQRIGGVPVYDATPNSLPYSDPDPMRPDVPRVSTGWQVVTRFKN